MRRGWILLAHRTVGRGDHDPGIREAGPDACLDRNLSTRRHVPRDRLEQLDVFFLQAEDDMNHASGPVDADPDAPDVGGAQHLGDLAAGVRRQLASPSDEAADIRMWGDGSTNP